LKYPDKNREKRFTHFFVLQKSASMLTYFFYTNLH
jgi:hypothetical protein